MAATIAWLRPVVAFDPYHAAINISDANRPDGQHVECPSYNVKRISPEDWKGSQPLWMIASSRGQNLAI